jgi:hypothetical protein
MNNPTFQRQKEAVALMKKHTRIDVLVAFNKKVAFEASEVDINRVIVVVNELITDHVSYAEYKSIRRFIDICTLPII